jgi:hypothetical protein
MALLIIPIWLTVVIGLLVFWIWILLDCIKNESTEGNERIVWVVVIAVTHWIGGLIYLFARRPKRKAILGR